MVNQRDTMALRESIGYRSTINRGLTMLSISALMDRAIARAGLASDYALFKRLGHTSQARVSKWRNGKAVPEDDQLVALCELSGDDAELVIVEAQALRAVNDRAAAAWERVAVRLRRVALVILSATLANLVLSPLENATADELSTVYYVKWIVWFWASGEVLAQLAKIVTLLTRKAPTAPPQAQSRVSPE